MATGCLSAWQIPDFPGLEVFEGDYYHTANWPKDGVDFTGRRAAVIGTGSTGIQSIPIIAEQAEHLYVFQRTPNYSIPANNDPLTEEEAQKFKEMYPEIREKARHSGFGIGVLDIAEESALGLSEEEQQELMWKGWKAGGFRFLLAHPNVLVDEEENEMVAQFVRDRIEDIVDDPEVAELLKPTDYPIGTKRICVDSGYYKTFNRDNVELVDVNEAPIERITEKGLVTGGREYAFDTLVFATGFDAMTGALENIDISGKGGVKLTDKWSEGPRSYLGLMVAGFPNLFTVTGPGSPSVLSNMITSIEQHVEWLTDCIDWMREKGKTEIEATKSAEDDWVVHVNEVAHYTLYPQAESWYMGANIPGKPRVFSPYIGGVGAYREKCAEVAEQGYAGFKLRSADTKQSATPSVDAEAMATK